MRKIIIKRVFLIDEDHQQMMILSQDFIGTLPDQAILDALFEIGKDVWIGNSMYHLVRQNGQIHHLRYEVHTVTQYEKSWYNIIFDAFRRNVTYKKEIKL